MNQGFPARSHEEKAMPQRNSFRLAIIGLVAFAAWLAYRWPGNAEGLAEGPSNDKPNDPPLLAGVAKVEITAKDKLPPGDPLFAKALVIKKGQETIAVVTVDAVAIGGIGPIGDDFMPKLRESLGREPGLAPDRLMVNASHCHGIVVPNAWELAAVAVRQATKAMVPVRAGTGVAHENRIQENRRLRLRDGRESDVRHAYSLPPDELVAGAGPVDPEIGILKLERMDGSVLAVLYNFACHPIMGRADGGNTADLSGFASKVIEDSLGRGCVALFIQGCGGDINPARYKDVSQPRDAEPLGNTLGLTVLRGVNEIRCGDDRRLAMSRQVMSLPRANQTARIASLEAERDRLVKSLKGTTLDLKTFLPLAVRYQLDPRHPSYSSHAYLTEKSRGQSGLEKLDEQNRAALAAYVANIRTMEELTRIQTNLALLERHRKDGEKAGWTNLEAEVMAMRVAGFAMVTFPGEVTTQVGLNIKKASPVKPAFVAGYTNGYLFYAPTAEQARNPGSAQEDSDCKLAPEWQAMFEDKAARMLGGI